MKLKSKGFTLMELLIAVFILAIVMSSIYAGFAGTVKITKDLEADINLERIFRIFAERVIDDLESFTSVPNLNFFLNTESKLTKFFKADDIRDKNEKVFLTFISDPFCPIGEEYPRKGPTLISYKLEKEKEGENYIIRRKAVPLSRKFQEREDILIADVKDVEISFVDKENQTRYDWNTLEGSLELPKMVIITLTLSGTPWGAKDFTETIHVAPLGSSS